jgi:K+-sensing histidine kinase KdpD
MDATLQPSPVLALVTLQRACARLIRSGGDMALRQHCPLHVLHVEVADGRQEPVHALDSQTLDYLYALSGEAGAEMTVLSAEVAVTAIAEFSRKIGARQIIMGDGESSCGMAETLSELLPGIQVMIVADPGEPAT